MRRWAAAWLVIVALGVAARTQAQDSDELTKQGLALRRQGRDAEALETFRRAYALRPSPRAVAQIALAEQALGLWVEAEVDLGKALQERDDPWVARHRQLLAEGLADIQKHLGGLEVDVDVTGAELWVNGVRAAALPIARPLRVESGSILVEVRAAGYAAVRRVTSVEAGETAHETIHLVPLAAPEPPADVAPPPPPVPALRSTAPSPALARPREAPPDHPMRGVAFVLFGAAGASATAGAFFGVRTLVAKSERDDHCRPGCDSTGVAKDAEARTSADQSTAWFVLGTVAAAAGVGLFVVSHARPQARASASLRVVASVSPGGGGAWLRGAW